MNTRLTQVQAWLTMMTVRMLVKADGSYTAGDRQQEEPDRGDVPGWVMITVMTAIVVIALLAVFREQVVTAVQNAFQSVSGAG